MEEIEYHEKMSVAKSKVLEFLGELDLDEVEKRAIVLAVALELKVISPVEGLYLGAKLMKSAR